MESKIKMTEQETELSVLNGIDDSKVVVQSKGIIVSAKTIKVDSYQHDHEFRRPSQ